jgi:hypothetical protein
LSSAWHEAGREATQDKCGDEDEVVVAGADDELDEMTELVVELEVELCGVHTADEASKHVTRDVPCVVNPIFDDARQVEADARAEPVKPAAVRAIWHRGACVSRLNPFWVERV